MISNQISFVGLENKRHFQLIYKKMLMNKYNSNANQI